MTWAVRVLGAALVLTGCEGAPTPVRDPAPPLQTDTLSYPLHRDEVGYRATIPFTYRNETGDSVFLANCRGDVRPGLEVLRDGKWYEAWAPYTDPCTSSPVVIPPGGGYGDTLRVFGAPPGSNVLPTFVFPEVEGVYRLVWIHAYRVYDADSPEDAQRLPLQQRVSNAFALVR